MTLRLRPGTAADEPFLRQLILETIAQELGAELWPEPLRSHLLGLQATGRRGADLGGHSFIIEGEEGRDLGWMVTRSVEGITWLIEIMVARDSRNHGVGSWAIRQLLENSKPVRLRVNCTNTAARRLYERLGFSVVEDNGVQQLMEAR